MLFSIEDLHVEIDGKPILKGFSLAIQPGEVHVIMGPNGAGKSTLAKVVAGHPAYEVTGGKILIDGEDILELEPEERAHRGLFMSFQYPVEVPGVNHIAFLRAAYNAHQKAAGKPELNETEFVALLDQKMEQLGIPPSFKERNVNEGFSGGEKKRNEILQMALFSPKIAILDETDSGLDIDALRTVAASINALRTPDQGLLLITHYQRLLDHLRPDFVHVMVDGEIVESGDASLALSLEESGYDTYTEATS